MTATLLNIGETARQLNTRVAEHFRPSTKNSLVDDHKKGGHNINSSNVKILETDWFRTRDQGGHLHQDSQKRPEQGQGAPPTSKVIQLTIVSEIVTWLPSRIDGLWPIALSINHFSPSHTREPETVLRFESSQVSNRFVLRNWLNSQTWFSFYVHIKPHDRHVGFFYVLSRNFISIIILQHFESIF